AIVDAASLGDHVKPALALLLRHLAPLRAVLQLNAEGAGHDETEAHPHQAAQEPHAHLDPASAAGGEGLHQRSARAPAPGGAPAGLPDGGAVRAGPTARPVIGMIRSAAGGCIPRSVRATTSTRWGVS